MAQTSFTAPMEYEVEGDLFRVKHAQGPCPEAFEEEHQHPSFELFLFLSGEADFWVGGKCYHLNPNSLLIIPPKCPHHIVMTGKVQSYNRIVLWFHRELLPWELWEQLLAQGAGYRMASTNVLGEFLRLDHIYQSMAPNFLADAMLQAIRQTLYFLLSSPGAPELRTSGSWEQISAYIDDNLAGIHTIEDLCHQFHMSRSALHKLFSSHSKASVMGYIRSRRCVRAQILLESGLAPSEVYLRCGFRDYSTFYRCMVQQYGCPPSELAGESRQKAQDDW